MAISADFELLADSPNPAWLMRVRIQGVALPERAVPIVGAVGNLPLQGLTPTFDEGLQGFLVAEPPVGAPLRLGYQGGELIDTGITYQPPVA